MILTLQELATLMKARLLQGSPSQELCWHSGSVSTDSRQENLGGIYVPLVGERFDGHDFCLEAVSRGNKVIFSRRPLSQLATLPASVSVLLVEDTLLTLQALAKTWREEELSDLPVVAITGSNGKTSTKDLCAAVLGTHFKTQATKGNLNNHIGLPQTILSTPPDSQAAVWEMGMNHPGELAPLCDMARPLIGVITHIGSAHLEFMKTREAIAQEKATLARALPKEGTLIFPATDDFASYLATQTQAQCLPVGTPECAFYATELEPKATGTSFCLHTPLGQASLYLPVPGAHMVTNALLAAATAYRLGLCLENIVLGLSSGQLSSGRLRPFMSEGRLVLDDTYNANPDSMKAALTTLCSLSADQGHKKVAFLGKMGELGDFSEQGHWEVGVFASTCALDKLIVIGEEARALAEGAKKAQKKTLSVQFFSTPKEALATLAGQLETDTCYLFKASRSARMEGLMQALLPEDVPLD